METLILTDELKKWKPNIADISERLIMGPQRDALERVQQINTRYSLNLGITKTYRWSPGYMDQIKDYMATRHLEPHMKRRISTYFNQIDNKHWNYTNLRDNLNRLDDILSSMRARNQIFQDNSELVDRVWDGVRGILEDEIKNSSGYYDIYVGHYKFHYESSWRANEDQIDKPALVFVFHLPETVCNYFIGNQSYPIPIYAATLYYAIDFDDFLYRISSNLAWLDTTDHFRNNVDILTTGRQRSYNNGNRGTYNQMQGVYHRNYINETNSNGRASAYSQLLHPYISSDEFNSTSRRFYNLDKETHNTAYCCLGDHQTSIETALRKLELGKIYSILYNWHTVYNSQSTHPMNGPQQMFFGRHKFMDETFLNVIAANEEDCRIKATSNNGPKTYCDDYECLHRKTCNYYNFDSAKAVAIEEPNTESINMEEVEAAIDHEVEEERSDEEVLAEYARIAEENGEQDIHGGELELESLSMEEQMIIWASQRGGAINIANNERENNG